MDEKRIWDLMAKKMANEATQEELEELAKLFNSDPELEHAYFVINSLHNQTSDDFSLSAEEEQKLLDRKLKEIDEFFESPKEQKIQRRSAGLWKPLWAAASVLVVCAAALFYFSPKKTNKVHAPVAAVNTSAAYIADAPTTITLQDGTRVWLNSGSTLHCASDFGKKIREVNLSGEAYFEVTHNAEKPFIVQAGTFMKVKVLGTTFNIKAYPNDPYVEASLITGKITIDLNHQKRPSIILQPHEKITFFVKDSLTTENDAQADVKPADFQIHRITPNPLDQHISELSWMTGELAFTDVAFQQLAFDLERRFHTTIEFKDDKMKDFHLTGVFKNESLQEVLQALQVTTPFKFTISPEKVLIYN